MQKLKPDHHPEPARRKLLKISAPLASLPILGPALTGLLLKSARSEAALTPACEDGALTQAQSSGPFYTPNSPLRDNLREAGMPGEPMRLSGRVLNQFCEPVSKAILDFWHADSDGVYDNQGFRLRGHVYSDDAGRFVLNTLVPGLYPGRTRHIHVITQGQATRALTTQLYFPDERENQSDFGYKRQLELTPQQAGEYVFDFVLLEPG
jgi:protocatechuate 3,4-dioxygenase beta subunit